jgi:hypothetical protein
VVIELAAGGLLRVQAQLGVGLSTLDVAAGEDNQQSSNSEKKSRTNISLPPPV